ncbi:hypothetical protein HOK68_01700 [Candidatus Woesearchaeota archaeon]|jgi:uncharacterized protein (TIGR00251 family)|nr:hypothetical protein [Candidatus Woesearchaeota archaeon]MBT4387211.1 hypothetical protein [Candidatus Woesearchaeota archaeon]MBT4596213.1 hypothetical protein [Candidatus Woesearchaeota archaeon]MBT5741564.1 hypothetical protein [Candidatus Woesearchaeota archaeon]MBT6505475.1 hypothetical protein [Candidatus Woesearchaeota archaeon]
MNFANKEFLELKIKPNSNESKIIEYDEINNLIYIKVKSQPINNKANIEVLNLLKKLTKNQYEIISGKNSKKKILKKLN